MHLCALGEYDYSAFGMEWVCVWLEGVDVPLSHSHRKDLLPPSLGASVSNSERVKIKAYWATYKDKWQC